MAAELVGLWLRTPALTFLYVLQQKPPGCPHGGSTFTGCVADQFASAANPCRSIASAQAMQASALSTFCMWTVTTRFSPTST